MASHRARRGSRAGDLRSSLRPPSRPDRLAGALGAESFRLTPRSEQGHRGESGRALNVATYETTVKDRSRPKSAARQGAGRADGRETCLRSLTVTGHEA